MNTELLREDERDPTEDKSATIWLLRQRVVEEREKNAKSDLELSNARWLYNEAAGEMRRTLAELAEARKDSERLDWALERAGVSMCRNSVTSWLHNRASIDAAMKEEK